MGNLIARNGRLLSDGNPAGWIYSETVADGATSDPVKIKPNGKGIYAISVGIIPETGSGKVQFSLDSESDIDGGSADWFDWSAGEVTGGTSATFTSAISALRCISISGNVKFKILI